jgi:hypothetical protein
MGDVNKDLDNYKLTDVDQLTSEMIKRIIFFFKLRHIFKL